MSRAERLMALMQCLRMHRRPIQGAVLASELSVSLRPLYRDIATLQAQGARIDGEAGVGYVLRPGFTLPPLMFTEDEIEALALGTRWVADRADGPLAAAAHHALAKIAAVLPPHLRHELDVTALLGGPVEPLSAGEQNLATVRRAIRAERKLKIDYQDLKDQTSSRVIWPFALGFLEKVRIIVAWCETRQDFRHFRADRIRQLCLPGPLWC
jgi:predicted DNA-binding transcriptional regulator YafY